MGADDRSPADLDALALRERVAGGSLSARALAEALLARVAEREPAVQAWTCLDEAHLRRQADAFDAARARGGATGLLAGLPVGLKDIIDTADLPTENGTVLHAGRQPREDAWAVRALRSAGALVMGKTVTTELATYHPGKTRHPMDEAHTPGGSSSGSAAAVACGMVPLAVGTQTGGSVIRPAAFCGVVGYKPSAGLIPRTGVLQQSPSFDCLGAFARSVGGVALLAQAMAGHDPADPLSRARATPVLMDIALSDPPVPPRLGWVEVPFAERMDPDAREACAAWSARHAAHVEPCELPADTWDALGWHKLVMEAEIAGSFEDLYERGAQRLSPSLRGQIERGREVRAVDHRKGLAFQRSLLARIDPVFERFDALVMPSALGTAPRTRESTGDPIMCTLWSFLGMPEVTLPLLRGANGLPLGLQLIGRRDDDARLLRTARWVHSQLQA